MISWTNMANCRTGYKGAVFYMTKEKEVQPELKLWDSPGTTKNIRRTEKQDNWIFYGAKNSRCSMTGITVWSKKTARARIARATATCRYAVHPLRSTNRPSAVVLLYNMKLLPGSRPVSPAARREKELPVEPACRKNCKALRFILLRCCF